MENSYFAIVKATLNTKVYHYAEVIDEVANIYCGQYFKEGTAMEVFINMSPDNGRICKKCKMQELQR